MNLKHQYSIAMIGFALTSFGGGWLCLSIILGVPNISTINAIGAILMGLGLAITIKMLSTVKKIDLIIEEVDEDGI